MIRAAVLTACLLAAGAARAEIEVSEPRLRAVFDGARSAAAYFEIANRGAAPDRLVAVRTPVGMAMLHGSREEDGVVRMVPLEGIEIAAGDTAVLAPGGLHVMVMRLDPGALTRASLPLTLVFEHAGEIEIDLPVVLGREAPAGDGGHGASGGNGDGATE